MKNHVVSAITLLVALTALVLAISAHSEAGLIRAASNHRTISEELIRDKAQTAQAISDLRESIGTLSKQLGALEKEVKGDSSVHLLTEMSSALQTNANSSAQNAKDMVAANRAIREVQIQAQAAMNAAAIEIAAIRAEISKRPERR